MHFLIDIDDTVAVCTPRWMELAEKWFKAHKIKRIRGKSRDTYHLEDSFKMSEETCLKWRGYMFDEIGYDTLPVVEGAKEFIKWAQEVGHTITFVTARPYFLREVTEAWLAKNLELFEHPCVMYHSDTKPIEPLFATGLIDILIDNSELRCRNIANAGGCSILFTGVQVDALEDSDISMLQQAASFEQIRKIVEEK